MIALYPKTRLILPHVEPLALRTTTEWGLCLSVTNKYRPENDRLEKACRGNNTSRKQMFVRFPMVYLPMVYRHCDTLMDPDSFERSIAGETEIYCGRDISEKMHLAIGLRNHPAALTSHSHPLQLILLYKQRMMGKRRAMERGTLGRAVEFIHSGTIAQPRSGRLPFCTDNYCMPKFYTIPSTSLVARTRYG